MKEPLSCVQCRIPLPAELVNTGELRPCPNCATPQRLEVFPALFRETAKGSSGEAVGGDLEASCFYHGEKRATVVCASCGRYLCGLCDLELEGAHYCPSCLETAATKGKIASVENNRTLYDTLAVQLALGGLVIFYFSVVTAPLAIWLAVKHWNSPPSLVRGPSRWRHITAIVVASLQIIGMIMLIGFFLTR